MKTLTLTFLAIFLTVSAYAEENITITTYYPSPSGSYLDLNVQGTLLVGTTSTSASGAASRIEFTHSDNSSTNQHWNIDQQGSNTTNPRLRFFTEINSNTLPGQERLVIDNRNILFTGAKDYGNIIFQAPSDAINKPGGIIFQGAYGDQFGKIWAQRRESPASLPAGLYLVSGDGNTPDMTIDTNGNLGIGTTTPEAKLDVAGGVRFGSVSSSCNSSRAGTMRYNSGVMEFCDGSSWSTIGGSLDYRIVGRSTTYNNCSGGTITATCSSSYNRAIGGACRCGGDSPGGGRINSNNFVCSCGRASGSCSGSTTGYAQVVCVK
jgi:hypothetical protein